MNNNYKPYFKDNEELLKELERIHTKKYKFKELLETHEKMNPFIVELSGLPRTGKSECLNKVYDFFKASSIKIQKTKEPAEQIKELFLKEDLDKMSNLEFNDETLNISKLELKKVISQKPDIIIQDRGVVDNYFWYQMMYIEGKIDINTYENRLLNLVNDLIDTDLLFVMLAKPQIIILRDYINQIYLESRKKTTIERVIKLREAIELLIPVLSQNTKVVTLDTSYISNVETSIIVADKIMDDVKKKILTK